MDTLNNVVTSASKAIWGEQNPQTTAGNETAGQEPVSGMQGRGSATEPFDQGNAPNPTTPSGKTDTSNPTANLPSSEPKTSAMSEPTTSTGPSAAEIPSNPNNAAAGGGPKPLENTEGTGVTGSSAQKFAPSGGDVVPSSASDNPGVAPSSGAAPGGQKQQGADRPQDTPSEPSAVKEDDTEAIMAKRDPNDHSGEPMHMHGGDEKVPGTQEERRESKVGMPGGQEHGKEHGTGEQWVKTSGMHADGGDFDATKPGAGREADRLLEEKGIHRDPKGAMDKPDAAGTSSENTSEGKVSKMDKIKEKLHIGSKDK